MSQIGDAPYNYAVGLLAKFGLTPRDVQWVPIGTDVNGRAAALISGRVDATMLTAPVYFKLEQQGYKSLANTSDYDEIYAPTVYVFKKATMAANPKLAELLIKAHAEAIKRLYDDKAFAVKAYLKYNPRGSGRHGARVRPLHENQHLRAGALHAGGGGAVHDRSSGRRAGGRADEGVRFSQGDRQQPGGRGW